MRLIDADAIEYRESMIDSFYRTTDEIPVLKWVSKKDINNAPTIETEPVRHGKWIKENIVLTCLPPKSRWHCSGCGSIKVGYDESVLTPYCPNCGAKMDAKEESDETDISGND